MGETGMDATEMEVLAEKMAQAKARAAVQPDTPSSGEWQPAIQKQDATAKRGKRDYRLQSESPPTGRVEERPATCTDCARKFPQRIVFVGGGDDERQLNFKLPSLCPDCIEKAEQAEAEAEMRVQMEERSRPDHLPFIRRLEAAGVSPNVYHATLRNYDPSENPAALEAARNFVKGVLSNPRAALPAVSGWPRVTTSVVDYKQFKKWLYTWGPTGPGKTHMLVGIARALYVTGYPGKVIIDTAPHFVRQVQGGYGKGSEADRMIESRITADVWLLDDLGRSKQKDDAVAIVSDILHAREGRWTAISSNYPREGLPARHTDYETLTSRLGPRFCVTTEVKGKDRREEETE